MKKYRVLKKYPKQIMNSGRMVTLQPKTTVYLRYERQLDRLIMLGYIKEVLESKPAVRTPPPAIQAEKSEQPKPQLVKPQKPKAKYQQDEALEDKTGE